MLQSQKESLKCMFSNANEPQNPLVELVCTEFERLETGKEHQPALTPTKESKAGPASTPVSPLGPQSNGSGGHFTQEKQIVGEEQHKQEEEEEGEMSKPFAFFYHISVSQNILYYNKVYSNTYSP